MVRALLDVVLVAMAGGGVLLVLCVWWAHGRSGGQARARAQGYTRYATPYRDIYMCTPDILP